MKKIYFLLTAALFSMGMLTNTNAQLAPKLISSPKAVIGQPKTISNMPAPKTNNKDSRLSTESYWLNSALANDEYLGGTPQSPVYDIGAYPLFPDSQALFQFSNGNFNTFIHMCGNVLDPLAANMQSWSGNSWNKSNSYTVDSMIVGYSYNRTTGPGIVDTLVVYLFSDADTSNHVGTFYFSAGPLYDSLGINPSTDTLLWKQIQYKYQTNKPDINMNVAATIKIPLTEADSGVQEKPFFTGNYPIPAGYRAISVVQFIPGYTYTLNEVVSQTKNDFNIIYFEENGQDTWPTYFSSTFARDWNVSEIVRTSERYNEAGNSWNGYFLPSWAFVRGYAFEQWDIYYKVSSTNVGLETISATGATKLFQNQPNPSNTLTDIKYETSVAGAVTIEVRDMTGRMVMEMNEGMKSAGVHKATVNVSGLSKGIYLYTLKTNTESLTRRMIISE